MTETTKEVHRMTAYATTYAVAITAGGVTYNFHLDTKAKVRDLFMGSSEVTALVVHEETHYYNERPNFRLMSDTEVQDIIWGRTAKTTASVV